MTREDAVTKGRRYASEGRLRVLRVAPHQIDAECRGDGQVYRLGFTRAGWHCTCAAKARCCHLYALGLVVTTGGPS